MNTDNLRIAFFHPHIIIADRAYVNEESYDQSYINELLLDGTIMVNISQWGYYMCVDFFIIDLYHKSITKGVLYDPLLDMFKESHREYKLNQIINECK